MRREENSARGKKPLEAYKGEMPLLLSFLSEKIEGERVREREKGLKKQLCKGECSPSFCITIWWGHQGSSWLCNQADIVVRAVLWTRNGEGKNEGDSAETVRKSREASGYLQIRLFVRKERRHLGKGGKRNTSYRSCFFASETGG